MSRKKVYKTVRVLWVLIVGGWLFLFSNPNTCFLYVVVISEMDGRRRRDKETIEAIVEVRIEKRKGNT